MHQPQMKGRRNENGRCNKGQNYLKNQDIVNIEENLEQKRCTKNN